MEIGLAVTLCLHSTKIAFQLWVKQFDSRNQLSKYVLSIFETKKILFFNIKKDGSTNKNKRRLYFSYV